MSYRATATLGACCASCAASGSSCAPMSGIIPTSTSEKQAALVVGAALVIGYFVMRKKRSR